MTRGPRVERNHDGVRPMHLCSPYYPVRRDVETAFALVTLKTDLIGNAETLGDYTNDASSLRILVECIHAGFMARTKEVAVKKTSDGLMLVDSSDDDDEAAGGGRKRGKKQISQTMFVPDLNNEEFGYRVRFFVEVLVASTSDDMRQLVRLKNVVGFRYVWVIVDPSFDIASNISYRLTQNKTAMRTSNQPRREFVYATDNGKQFNRGEEKMLPSDFARLLTHYSRKNCVDLDDRPMPDWQSADRFSGADLTTFVSKNLKSLATLQAVGGVCVAQRERLLAIPQLVFELPMRFYDYSIVNRALPDVTLRHVLSSPRLFSSSITCTNVAAVFETAEIVGKFVQQANGQTEAESASVDMGVTVIRERAPPFAKALRDTRLRLATARMLTEGILPRLPAPDVSQQLLDDIAKAVAEPALQNCEKFVNDVINAADSTFNIEFHNRVRLQLRAWNTDDNRKAREHFAVRTRELEECAWTDLAACCSTTARLANSQRAVLRHIAEHKTLKFQMHRAKSDLPPFEDFQCYLRRLHRPSYNLVGHGYILNYLLLATMGVMSEVGYDERMPNSTALIGAKGSGKSYLMNLLRLILLPLMSRDTMSKSNKADKAKNALEHLYIVETQDEMRRFLTQLREKLDDTGAERCEQQLSHLSSPHVEFQRLETVTTSEGTSRATDQGRIYGPALSITGTNMRPKESTVVDRYSRFFFATPLDPGLRAYNFIGTKDDERLKLSEMANAMHRNCFAVNLIYQWAVHYGLMPLPCLDILVFYGRRMLDQVKDVLDFLQSDSRPMLHLIELHNTTMVQYAIRMAFGSDTTALGSEDFAPDQCRELLPYFMPNESIALWAIRQQLDQLVPPEWTQVIELARGHAFGLSTDVLAQWTRCVAGPQPEDIPAFRCFVDTKANNDRPSYRFNKTAIFEVTDDRINLNYTRCIVPKAKEVTDLVNFLAKASATPPSTHKIEARSMKEILEEIATLQLRVPWIPLLPVLRDQALTEEVVAAQFTPAAMSRYALKSVSLFKTSNDGDLYMLTTVAYATGKAIYDRFLRSIEHRYTRQRQILSPTDIDGQPDYYDFVFLNKNDNVTLSFPTYNGVDDDDRKLFERFGVHLSQPTGPIVINDDIEKHFGVPFALVHGLDADKCLPRNIESLYRNENVTMDATPTELEIRQRT